ncbi:MAG: undecaprenyldiphospho-muramoylpentapeptide beta-N-acetylglucosaminyltransferase [Myxococcota bacterium]
MKVLIAGGGTGGHVFPMLAVADALRALRDDVEIVFVGTGRGLEARLVPARGDRLKTLDVRPLRGAGITGFLRGVGRASGVLPEARALVAAEAPAVVFSVGGYAAGPVALAAWSLRIPVTLMEPNAVSGLTNRILRPFIRRAYVGFPETVADYDPRVVTLTGVPLRAGFTPAPYPGRYVPHVLVMGGSQGALALNDTVPQALAACRRAGLAMRITHQTGRGKDEAVRAQYADGPFASDRVEVVPFIEDVAGALADADFVVARSGAGATAELCAVGRPGLLIPFPFAADDHQRHNAASLARSGAVRCVVQAEATVARLTAELRDVLRDRDRRVAMAEAASARGRTDAATAVARDLLWWGGEEVRAA